MSHYSRKGSLMQKSIDPGQPAQTVQVDLIQDFLLLVNFLHVNEPVLPNNPFGC